MSFFNLEELPAELHILLLSHLDSPRDLYAFITSSKHIQVIFKYNRGAILGAVIRNAFPGENINIAITACEASETSKIWWSGQSTELTSQSQQKFTKTHPRLYKTAETASQVEMLSLPLYKLWWTLDFFVSYFERTSLAFAGSNMPVAQKQSTREMSSSERSRLQRAFLLFEIYRRVTPMSLSRSAGDLWPDDRAQLTRARHTMPFLKLLPPWEREEVLSIHEFLVNFVKDIYEDVGKQVVSEVSILAHDFAAQIDDIQEAHDEKEVKYLCFRLDMGGGDPFPDMCNVGVCAIQYCVARGLPFLKWLCKIPFREQTSILEDEPTDCDFPFFETIWYQDDILSSIDFDTCLVNGNTTGSLRGPNHGWVWAESHGLMVDKDSLLSRYKLRRAGYVFWDSMRLNEDWKLSSISLSALQLPQRLFYSSGEEFFRKRHIKDRVKGILIPKGTFTKGTDPSKHLNPGPIWSGGRHEHEHAPTPFSDREGEVFFKEY